MGIAILQAYLDKIPEQIERWRNTKGTARAPIVDEAVNILMEQFAELTDKNGLKKVKPTVHGIVIFVIHTFL